MTKMRLNLNSDATPPEPFSGEGFALLGAMLLTADVWLLSFPVWLSLVLTACIFLIIKVLFFERP